MYEMYDMYDMYDMYYICILYNYVQYICVCAPSGNRTQLWTIIILIGKPSVQAPFSTTKLNYREVHSCKHQWLNNSVRSVCSIWVMSQKRDFRRHEIAIVDFPTHWHCNEMGQNNWTIHFHRLIMILYLVGGLEHILFSHLLGSSSSQLTNSYVSEGYLYHQPDIL